MPYEFQLEELVDTALNNPDIRAGIDDPNADITLEGLRLNLLARKPAIEAAALSIKLQYDQAEKELEEARRQRDERMEPPSDTVILEGLFAIALPILVVGGAITGLSALGRVAWALSFLGWLGSLRTSPWALATLALAGVGFLRIGYWRLISRPRRLDELRASDRTLDLELARNAARSAVDAQMASNLTKLATERINQASSQFFQNRLSVNRTPADGERETSGPGLAEVLNPSLEINTRNRRALLELIRKRTSANIGVAGPRGVGKSTLLISLCNLDIAYEKKTSIGIYTAAPVDYDARDFLLHLYASVCRRVLQAKGLEEEEPADLTSEMPVRDGFRPDVVGRLLVLLSAASLLVALVLALIVVETTKRHAMRAEATKAIPTSTVKGALPARGGASDVLPGDLIAAIGIQPAIFANLAVVGFAAGLILIFQDPQSDDLPFLTKAFVRLGIRRRPGFRGVDSVKEPDPLGSQARRALREIRFQRTYASGWNGALKLPVGVEMGRSLGVTLARTQQTLPELVAAFKAFLAVAAEAFGRVIVAIDELDKLRSDEEAEAFLNEVKAVFDVQGCFFLVSVSESAISNFERRGLPFRDAFDSAFDDIHYVDYLDLEATRRLLARRVLNLPEPCLALSYVLSGGLPREVIRVARSILNFAETAKAPPTIGEIAIGLLRAEVAAKCRAMGFLARDIDLDPDATEFLSRLAALEAFDPLWDLPRADLAFASPQTPAQNGDAQKPSEADLAARRRLWKLRRELDCFLYFVMTTAQLFDRAMTEQVWSEIMDAGHVKRLARARQALELGPGLAIVRIREVRTALDLAV